MKVTLTTQTAKNTAELVEALEYHGGFDVSELSARSALLAVYRQTLASEWYSLTKTTKKEHKDAAAMLTEIIGAAETLEVAEWMIELVAYQIHRYRGANIGVSIADIPTKKLARFAGETQCLLRNAPTLCTLSK